MIPKLFRVVVEWYWNGIENRTARRLDWNGDWDNRCLQGYESFKLCKHACTSIYVEAELLSMGYLLPCSCHSDGGRGKPLFGLYDKLKRSNEVHSDWVIRVSHLRVHTEGWRSRENSLMRMAPSQAGNRIMIFCTSKILDLWSIFADKNHRCQIATQVAIIYLTIYVRLNKERGIYTDMTAKMIIHGKNGNIAHQDLAVLSSPLPLMKSRASLSPPLAASSIQWNTTANVKGSSPPVSILVRSLEVTDLKTSFDFEKGSVTRDNNSGCVR